MAHIINIDGSMSKEFPGFGLEPGIWNVGFMGEWYTHTIYLPVAHTDSYSYAKEQYDLAQRLTSCGVRVVLCFGNIQKDPECLDENGLEVEYTPCCIDESCIDCLYLKSLDYCPDRGISVFDQNLKELRNPFI